MPKIGKSQESKPSKRFESMKVRNRTLRIDRDSRFTKLENESQFLPLYRLTNSFFSVVQAKTEVAFGRLSRTHSSRSGKAEKSIAVEQYVNISMRLKDRRKCMGEMSLIKINDFKRLQEGDFRQKG